MSYRYTPTDTESRDIKQKLNHCLHRAEVAFQRTFPTPSINFKLRGKAAGKAYLQLNEIRLNPILFQENSQAFIDEVLPHEFAHHIVHQVFGRVRPHGKEWQMVMEKIFSVQAKTTHCFSIDSVQGKTFEYQCGCDTHSLTIRRHNKVIRQQSRYLCRQCGESLLFTGRQLS
ncbi:SprT family zinc-dependent metalloprotease [Vibrio albus]|uniref:Protein SprT n=1 Tax=Vibrio albus TaxID=2200953 RepID=A0A2U3B5Y1_9VIBR|nr:SprT family zinc-dependent metalloprotease [Vibrio albus]PWI32125.1 SprT family zinc-dependent metalloprotease [Vibrio albus]